MAVIFEPTTPPSRPAINAIFTAIALNGLDWIMFKVLRIIYPKQMLRNACIYLKAVGYKSITTELTTLPTKPMHINARKKPIWAIGVFVNMHTSALKLLVISTATVKKH